MAYRDFFWPAAKTFAKRVSEGAGVWRMAKRWHSRRASPKGMDKAPKKMLGMVQKAVPILLCCYLGPLLILFYG